VHRATEWLRPSFARSSATMSASVRDQMPKPSCVSCQLGSPTTTRFTRTRLSDIVHPVSSSQLTQDPNRVRSFGGYNRCGLLNRHTSPTLAELLMPLPAANPFSTMRASLRWYSSEELEDGVTYGGQSWLRRGSVDSFFSALLLRDGDAAGRRKR